MRRAKKQIACYFLTGLLGLAFLAGCAKDEEILIEDVKQEEPEAEKKSDTGEKSEKEIKPEEAKAETVIVYVCGAVLNPGVYEMPRESRIYEAIEAAGNMTEEAAEEYLNQAEKVVDGQRIYIPTEEEMKVQGEPSGFSEEMQGTKEAVQGKININTASKEELMTLPGIGEAKAVSIIAYREKQGGFGSIEEMKNIEGIKEGVFGKIKDDITI